MHKIIVALALVVGLTVGAAPPAGAHSPDKRHCVTWHEYAHVKKGHAKRRVHRSFDTRGGFWDGHAGGYTRVYEPCWTRPRAGQLHGGYRVVFVTYQAPKKGAHRVVEKRIALP